MPDRLTPEQRHRCMSHIRSKDTKPELLVRRWLWDHGYRYRLNVKSVPGKPDIVLRKYRTAIFVNGCFWHGHGVQEEQGRHGEHVGHEGYVGQEVRVGEKGVDLKDSVCCKIPKSNRAFWVNKILRNQERDRKNYEVLQENGWQVIVVWECQLKPKILEQTMLQVEVSLQDYYLRTFNRQAKTYIHLDEDTPIPMAAEDLPEYNL